MNCRYYRYLQISWLQYIVHQILTAEGATCPGPLYTDGLPEIRESKLFTVDVQHLGWAPSLKLWSEGHLPPTRTTCCWLVSLRFEKDSALFSMVGYGQLSWCCHDSEVAFVWRHWLLLRWLLLEFKPTHRTSQREKLQLWQNEGMKIHRDSALAKTLNGRRLKRNSTCNHMMYRSRLGLTPEMKRLKVLLLMYWFNIR